MNISYTIYLYIDSFLIWFYRLSDNPSIGYFLGTTFIVLICVVAGQFTLSFAWRLNRKWLDKSNNDMVHYHNLSMKALASKDKNSYKACNKEANDAFGKQFFSQIALSISSLWPIPFALGWMQTRFAEVDFHLPIEIPFIGSSVGYTFTFIPIYILVYILFVRVKHHLPYFNKMKKLLESQQKEAKKMVSIDELIKTPSPNKSVVDIHN